MECLFVCAQQCVYIYIYCPHSMWSHHAFTCTSSFPQIWSKDASPLWHKFEWVPETIKLCFSWMFWYLLERGCIDFRLFVSVFGLAYTCTWLCICTYTICFVLLVGMSAGVRPHAALSGVTMSLPAAFTRTWTCTHHIHTHPHTCTPAHLHQHTHAFEFVTNHLQLQP